MGWMSSGQLGERLTRSNVLLQCLRLEVSVCPIQVNNTYLATITYCPVNRLLQYFFSEQQDSLPELEFDSLLAS